LQSQFFNHAGVALEKRGKFANGEGLFLHDDQLAPELNGK
jgi:hypothetical protein